MSSSSYSGHVAQKMNGFQKKAQKMNLQPNHNLLTAKHKQNTQNLLIIDLKVITTYLHTHNITDRISKLDFAE